MTTDASPAIRIPMDPGTWAAMFRLAFPVLRTPGLHRAPTPAPDCPTCGSAAVDIRQDGALLHRPACGCQPPGRCLYSATITTDVPGQEKFLLVCDRIDPAHLHDDNGVHWDETDNISWKYGCPPGEQEARGA